MICFKTARLSMCTHRHKQKKEMNKIYIRNVSCSKSTFYSVLRLSACPFFNQINYTATFSNNFTLVLTVSIVNDIMDSFTLCPHFNCHN